MITQRKGRLFFLLLFLSGWALPCISQVTGYFLEWEGRRIAIGSVTGLDGSSTLSTTRLRTITSNQLNTTSVTRSISVQKLLVRSDSGLFQWFSEVSQATRTKKDIRIGLAGTNGEVVKSWRIVQASPLKMQSLPTLSAEANDITIESIVLSYEKIEPDW